MVIEGHYGLSSFLGSPCSHFKVTESNFITQDALRLNKKGSGFRLHLSGGCNWKVLATDIF
jgi:hypothetical protein